MINVHSALPVDDTRQPVVLSPKTREEFRRAATNAVGHAKRSLLMFLEFQKGQQSGQKEQDLIGYLMRRVHNDVSIIEHQVHAAFEIVCNGGIIPAFGRPEEERLQQKRSA